MYAIAFPAIDPVAIEIGPLVIRWYSLAYVLGILLGWQYAKRLAPRTDGRIESVHIDDFIIWATLGVILGGRLGYVLFYRPGYFLDNPLEIFAMWKGGMSFHGGTIGVIVAIALFSLKRGLPFLSFADLIAAATPIGLFFGRIANFVNGELYGRATDVPWAVVFPRGGPEPRHPSQLYEAALEGLVLFALLAVLIFAWQALRRPGLVTGVFLTGYAVARFLVEYVREPDAHLGTLLGLATMGQLLSLPLAIAGIWLIRRATPPDVTPLERAIRARIRRDGKLPVSEYMRIALTHPDHGYYASSDPLGARGDFITGPEISQAFGEIIGLWCAVTWQRAGCPRPVRLVKLGPGRGTLMADALRAARAVPEFAAAAELHLVETSPTLRDRQRAMLAAHAPRWHDTPDTVPAGPALIVANEFFDALPVEQYVRSQDGWRRRCVGIDPAADRLVFVTDDETPAPAGVIPRDAAAAPVGSLFEHGPAGCAVAASLGSRIAGHGIAALIIDYGHARRGAGETLQAVRAHRRHDVLADPGKADLTAHVDFAALRDAAAAGGARCWGPVPQGAFLAALGLEQRTERLAAGAGPGRAALLRSGCRRLVAADGMGALFKVLALTQATSESPAGFETGAQP